MTKVRVLLFLLTFLVVGAFGVFFSYYARGYRLDFTTLRFQPNGILVIQSEPTGASVYIDGDLRTATNASLSISPGTYDIQVKKEGYFPWYKRLTIQKEIVTTAIVSLYKNVPSLSPITFSGAKNPVVSEDGTVVAFEVLPSPDATADKEGLWTIDTFSLPLGFLNDPKRITDGDMTNASYIFSPDGRQILLTTSNGIFLLDSGSFTAQGQLVNVVSKKDSVLASWQKEKVTKNESLIRGFPSEINDLLTRRTSDFVFSPDGNMILYSASSAATLSDNLIPQLPGASTQKQVRDIQSGQTYIYDIKEDRNFLISNQPVVLTNQPSDHSTILPAIRWMPSGNQLLLAQNGQVIIMDYDGTNRQVVYSGSYIAPFAFPYSNSTKLLILTNLGGASNSTNLYSLTVK